MKVLIVEDDEDSRVFLERALRGHHYSVESAGNGVEALGKAYEWHPDLIISDILMPGMNGFELCRRVKTDEKLRNIPFIFYTATFVDQNDEKLAMALGASRFHGRNDSYHVLPIINDDGLSPKMTSYNL
jgi:CheY-like chemotaxis protein